VDCLGNLNPSGGDLSQVLGTRGDVEIMIRCANDDRPWSQSRTRAGMHGAEGKIRVSLFAAADRLSAYLPLFLVSAGWCVITCSHLDTLYAVFSGWSTDPWGLGFVANYLTRRLTIDPAYVLPVSIAHAHHHMLSPCGVTFIVVCEVGAGVHRHVRVACGLCGWGV
jgi:hypothetical protein